MLSLKESRLQRVRSCTVFDVNCHNQHIVSDFVDTRFKDSH